MSDPRILAVETSGKRGSLAVAEGPNLIDEIGFATDRERARDLLPCADELLRKHGWLPGDLEHCYISIGPGSFTGLRIAVTLGRHLALAVGVKLRSVPTLDVIAANALAISPRPKLVAAILDAKKDQVFASGFELDGESYRCIAPPRMVDPAKFVGSLGGTPTVLGEGLEHHSAAVEKAGGVAGPYELWWPHASNVCKLGWELAQRDGFIDAVALVPDYVRRPEAEEVWDAKFGVGGSGQNQ